MSGTHGNSGDNHHGPAAPPEPKTPMWLPALGVFLFLVAGLMWGLSASDSAEGAPGGTAADAGAAPR